MRMMKRREKGMYTFQKVNFQWKLNFAYGILIKLKFRSLLYFKKSHNDSFCNSYRHLLIFNSVNMTNLGQVAKLNSVKSFILSGM